MVEHTIAFYRDQLGFETRWQQPARNPWSAIIGRDGAQIFIKSEKGVAPPAEPQAPSPYGLAAEFAGNGAAFSVLLNDTSDGLRGFEISDPDG